MNNNNNKLTFKKCTVNKIVTQAPMTTRNVVYKLYRTVLKTDNVGSFTT